jgi:hypothetical protein
MYTTSDILTFKTEHTLMFILPVQCALELEIENKDPLECTVNNHTLVIKGSGKIDLEISNVKEEDQNVI